MKYGDPGKVALPQGADRVAETDGGLVAHNHQHRGGENLMLRSEICFRTHDNAV